MKNNKSLNIEGIMKTFRIFMLMAAVILISCSSPKKSEKQEDIKYQTTASGLKFIDIEIGDGDPPKYGQKVTIHQIVKTDESDVEIENTRNTETPVTFELGSQEVIQGINEGLYSMKVGGKRILYIPPEMGFGSRNVRGIPGRTTLVIEVELISFK